MTIRVCVCSGITNAPLYAKTDKSDPMGASVAITNAIAGQPTERGASPILYAAASKELNGKCVTHAAWLEVSMIFAEMQSQVCDLCQSCFTSSRHGPCKELLLSLWLL